MFDNSLAIPTWQDGCIEEMVILDETNEVYKYVFSNSLDDIKTAIFDKIGKKIYIEDAKWEPSSKLSKNVKCLMNSHNVNFSMTTYEENKLRVVKIYMRVGDKWFRTAYYDINGEFLSWYDLDLYKFTKEFITKLLDNPRHFKKYIRKGK